METKKPARPAVADKLVKVNAETHRRLKVKAAQQGKTIGELLEDFSKK
jgi:predicted HicB family RNase H-like nuclease